MGWLTGHERKLHNAGILSSGSHCILKHKSQNAHLREGSQNMSTNSFKWTKQNEWHVTPNTLSHSDKVTVLSWALECLDLIIDICSTTKAATGKKKIGFVMARTMVMIC